MLSRLCKLDACVPVFISPQIHQLSTLFSHAKNRFLARIFLPIPRLGIPLLKMTDGPAGVRSAPASSFPSGLAASFDPKIVPAVGRAIAEETKAKRKNVLLAPCVNLVPCVNIERVPLWGRDFGCFGEVPFLAAQMSVAYIKGVQSENVGATVKHFAANNQEENRHTINVRIDERALREIYLPAFKNSLL